MNSKKIWLGLVLLVIAGALIFLMTNTASKQPASVNEPLVEEGGDVDSEISEPTLDEGQFPGSNYSDADRQEFEAFLRLNLSELSPEKEVLGGTFYLTSLAWINDHEAVIDYEDGHIALRAQVSFSYLDVNTGQVQVDNFSLLEFNPPPTTVPVQAEMAPELMLEEPIIEEQPAPEMEVMPAY